MRNGVRFQPHVHPETYTERDPLEWRRHHLHTRASQCELTWCTWADCDDDYRQEFVDKAKALRKEIAAANREAKKATR